MSDNIQNVIFVNLKQSFSLAWNYFLNFLSLKNIYIYTINKYIIK